MRFLLSFTFLLSTTAMAAEQRIYIGTYTRGNDTSDGIYTCLFDDATGKLTNPELAAKTDNPSFLAIHPTKDLLFACNEVNDFGGEDTGAVSAYRVDRKSGKLTLINQQSAQGSVSCHCVVDSTGKFLLVANYMGGNVSVLPINEDGSLEPTSCVINHVGDGPNKQRQEMPHAHSINLSSDNRFAYVADLGIDRVMIYRFDSENGILAPSGTDSVAVNPGGGPRHFSFHPTEKFAYTNNELTCEVVAFERNADNGGLTRIQTISTLPADFDGRKSTAECLVHANGKFLYVSNRGHDSIAVYSIDQKSGKLTLVEIEKTGGEEPRNFFIDPSGKWLIAENQNSDTIITFAVDQNSGALSITDARVEVGKPVCIRMLP